MRFLGCQKHNDRCYVGGVSAPWNSLALGHEESFPTSLLVTEVLLHGGVVLHILGSSRLPNKLLHVIDSSHDL